MKLLIKIFSSQPNICEEALSLAFAMVAFEHEVQLWLGEDCFPLLLEKNGNFGKMLSSLELYDMPPAWLSTENDCFTQCQKELANFPELNQQLIPLPNNVNLEAFESVIAF